MLLLGPWTWALLIGRKLPSQVLYVGVPKIARWPGLSLFGSRKQDGHPDARAREEGDCGGAEGAAPAEAPAAIPGQRAQGEGRRSEESSEAEREGEAALAREEGQRPVLRSQEEGKEEDEEEEVGWHRPGLRQPHFGVFECHQIGRGRHRLTAVRVRVPAGHLH